MSYTIANDYTKRLALAIMASTIALSLPIQAQASPSGIPSHNETSPKPAAVSDNTSLETETSIRSVRGFLPDLRFSLNGKDGITVTQSDLTGKVVLLFFGYSSCPDICPTTMAQLSMVLHQLGDQAQHVQIVFVSVDPHRDTPERLQAYVEAFDSSALGLTGSEKEIADVARRYRVAYQIEKPAANAPDNYEVAHGRGIYIFDQKGRARLLASDSESIDALTQSIQKLL